MQEGHEDCFLHMWPCLLVCSGPFSPDGSLRLGRSGWSPLSCSTAGGHWGRFYSIKLSDTDRGGQEERKDRNEPQRRDEGCTLYATARWSLGNFMYPLACQHPNCDDDVNPEGKPIPVGTDELFPPNISLWRTNSGVHCAFGNVPSLYSASVITQVDQDLSKVLWAGDGLNLNGANAMWNSIIGLLCKAGRSNKVKFSWVSLNVDNTSSRIMIPYNLCVAVLLF